MGKELVVFSSSFLGSSTAHGGFFSLIGVIGFSSRLAFSRWLFVY